MRIGAKLAFFFLACSLVPLLGMSFFAFDSARNSLRELISVELNYLAQEKLEQIETFFAEARTDLKSWSQLHIMQDVLIDDEAGDATDELRRLGKQYPYFIELLALNQQGIVVAAIDEQRRHTNLSTSPAQQATQGGKSYQGQVALSPITGNPALVLAEPIRASYDPETIIGALIGIIEWQQVQHMLAELTMFGSAQDADHRLILDSHASGRVLYDSLNGAALDFSATPQLKTGQGEDFEIMHTGDSYLVGSAWSKGSSNFRNPNWDLHALISTDVAYQSSDELRRQFLLAIAGFIVISVVIGYIIARSLVKPIATLGYAAQRLAVNDFATPLPALRSGEIGSLTQSFERMRSAIRQHQQQLLAEVSERKRAEMALREAKRAAEAASRVKSEFLATMSHEIRTPMNGVVGMLELLTGTDLDKKQQQMARTAQLSGNALLTLLDDMLDFSKIEAGKLELELVAFNPRTIVDEVSALMAEQASEKGLSFRCQIDESVPAVIMGDPGRLRQVLLNLASNAVKFTDQGEVVIIVQMDSPHQTECTGEAYQVLCFAVRDTGCGIPQQAQARLFHAFVQADASTTRRYGGTGLGLAISRQLVQLMGGKIGLDSELGVGSTLWFKLPVKRVTHNAIASTARSATDNRAAATAPAPAPFLDARILLIEDNPVNQLVAQLSLQKLGCESTRASNGREALVAFRTRRFDLILMDCQMPELDGYDTTRCLRELEQTQGWERTPIVAMTANVLAGDRERCIAAGMDDYLAKPFHLQELGAVLQRWLPVAEAVTPSDQPGKGCGGDPAAAGSNAAAALDAKTLAELRLLAADDDSFLEGLIAEYRHSTRALIATLGTGLEQNDSEAVRQAAHSIKSASNNLGAHRLAALCQSLEELARGGDLCTADNYLQELQAEYYRVDQALEVEKRLPAQAMKPPTLSITLPRILLADDDPTARRIARQALRPAGFHIETAASGREALTAFGQARPDLVLLDVEMPEGDGFSVCERLRARSDGQTVPILIVTGRDDLASIQRAYEVGATDFVSKPINWTILSQRLRYMLRASNLTRALALSQTSLAAAQRLARLGNWEWDLAAPRANCSDELYRLFGVERDAVPATFAALLKRTRFEDRRGLRDALLAPLHTGQPSRTTVRIRHAMGEQRTLLTHIETVLDGDGKAVQLRGTFQDITERLQTEAKIRSLAYYDSLTGLPNRRYFCEQVSQALALAKRYRRQLGILFIDLDDFKRINDSLGHNVGDLLLKAVAERMRTVLRASDGLSHIRSVTTNHALARLGGDEFTVLLTELRYSEDGAAVAERLIKALSVPLELAGHHVTVTPSIGIAVYPGDGADIDTLFRNADTAMYHAKRSGKASYRFYDTSMNEHALARLTLEQELRSAVDNAELTLVYQPQIHLVTDTVTGVEALLRWRNPRLGLLMPNQFITMAEETGLILPIGKWVIRSACAQAKAWQQQGLAPLRVAVNLSARQFSEPGLPKAVAEILAETGLEARYLELELTESMLIDGVEQAIKTMDALKALGVNLAIDDFGTGYSSLSYLKRFPIDRIKIDRVFVRDINHDSDAAAIALTVVAMAHNLKLGVVAEGVETEAQQTFLKRRNCDEIQGYLISRPLTPEQLAALLKARHNPTTCGAPDSREPTPLFVDD